MLKVDHNPLNYINKYRILLWATLILSYAYYVNMAPVVLPFPVGSLFGLNDWQNLGLLYARNLFVLAALLILLRSRPLSWRRHDPMMALLVLSASQAMCVFSNSIWASVLVRLLMSTGLALAMLSVSEVVADRCESVLSEWVCVGICFMLMHFVTDFFCYLLHSLVDTYGWLLAYRVSVLFGFSLLCAHLFYYRHSFASLSERTCQQGSPKLSWRLLLKDRTYILAMFWLMFLAIPMMYITSEMGLYSLYHLQKKAIHSILLVKAAFGAGWSFGFLFWLLAKPSKRTLPYCMTFCSALMMVNAIGVIFLQPLTVSNSLVLMFCMGFAFSGVLLALQVIRFRFKGYDGRILTSSIFVFLSLAGVCVSLLVLSVLVCDAWMDSGFRYVHLDSIFKGVMFISPFTSVFAILLSFYMSPIKSLATSKEERQHA